MKFSYDYDTSLDTLLREAGEHLAAGRKDEAREALRQALGLDREQPHPWELLWKAAYHSRRRVLQCQNILKTGPETSRSEKTVCPAQAAWW